MDNAGGVTARPIKAGDQTGLDWIETGYEDNRDRSRGRFRSTRCRGAFARCNEGNLAADEISGEFRQSICVILAPTEFNGDVALLDVTSLAQAPAKRRYKACASLLRAWVEIPDHRHRPLLRPRRQRPRRRRGAE